jgi:L-threonylcarbamoyladenylate synthase
MVDVANERLTVVDPATCGAGDLAAAAAWLRRGGIVAFPTDTVYGLAVDPRSAAAVDAVFALKGRPADGALPLVAASLEQVERHLGRLDAAGAVLAARFWPGPLALLIAAPDVVAAQVHAGTGAVAVRVPAHGVATALAAAFGYPVTATSANRSGEPPAIAARDLVGLAADRRVHVIDAGEAPGGPPSTIVDTRAARPRLVREGAVPWNRVLESLHA